MLGQIRLYMELYMRTLNGAIHARQVCRDVHVRMCLLTSTNAQKSKQLFLMSEMLPIALGVARGLQYLHTMPVRAGVMWCACFGV
jgi:hypothetical protein